MLFDPQKETEFTTRYNPILNVLIGARRLIEKPERWACYASGDENKKRCALQAIHACTDGYEEDRAAIRFLAEAMGLNPKEEFPGVGSWNDTHSHASVLKAFDRAIDLARHK
jgi:hypothetical protein